MRDPIAGLTHHLRDEGLMDQAAIDALDAEVHAEVDAAVKFADESPDPEPGALMRDVLADGHD